MVVKAKTLTADRLFCTRSKKMKNR